MLWCALPAVGLVWLLQYYAPQLLLVVPALAWLGLALLLWCVCGGRIALIALLAGWTLARADWVLERHLPAAQTGQDVLVQGRICDFPRGDAQAARFVLDVEEEVGDTAWPARIHVSWYDGAPKLAPGQRWQLRVRVKPPRGLLNAGTFDFEHWLYLRGIGATGYVRASPLNQALPAGRLTCPVGGLRSALAARIEAALGRRPGAGHVLGVVVGATHRLGEADWEVLRKTGTTHLLAISGLNIAMVAAPLLLAGPLVGRLWARAAGRPLLGVVPALLAATLYCALAGFAVSTLRALAMVLCAALLAVRRRRVGGADLLGAAALAVLVWDPAALMGASFWLSFVAVVWLFLATLSPERTSLDEHPDDKARERGISAGLSVWRYGRRAGGELLRLQLVLGLGLAPLTLVWFQQVSLIAPLANLVAVPVFSCAMMPPALLGAVLLVPLPAVGTFLLAIAAWVAEQLLTFLRLVAATDFAVWQPPVASGVGLSLAVLGTVVLCWWRPVPFRLLALACLLPLAVGTRVERPVLELTVLDVGQGLAVLVRTARHALLYDAGPALGMRDAGATLVVPAIRARGIRSLDTLLISHDDLDHRGGAAAVLEAFPRTHVIAPAGVLSAAATRTDCAAGLHWSWDGVEFRVLSPDPRTAAESDNDGSCVLHVRAPGGAALLPGDIERRREELLSAREQLAPAEVVLAPHHGSRSSSSPAFVAAARARVVLFSAGHRNRWGFPAAEVMQRWGAAGACLLSTAGSGAITLRVDERGWRVVRRERVHGAHLWTTAAEEADCAVN